MAPRRHSTTSVIAPVTCDTRQCDVVRRSRHNSSAASDLLEVQRRRGPCSGLPGCVTSAQELYNIQCRRLQSTGYLQQLEHSINRLRGADLSLPVLRRGICLALSSLSPSVGCKDFEIDTTVTGLTQLAVFDTVCQNFGLPRSSITVYDPCFTEADRAFLTRLGFHAPLDEFGNEAMPRIPILSEPTLVFHPGLEMADLLFKANFSPRSLANLVWLDGNQRSMSTLYGRSTTFGNNRVALIDSKIAARYEPLKRSAIVASSHALPNYHFHIDRTCQRAACPELARILDGEHWKPGEPRRQDYGLSSAANTLYWWPKTTIEMLPGQFWQVDSKMRIRTC